MYILLMRHGDAVPDVIDASRPLSEVGIKQVSSVCDFLDGQSIALNTICHSQKTRSEQTAKIIAGHYDNIDSLQYLQTLDPSADANSFLDELIYYEQNTLFVGHLPNIQIYLHQLLESSTKAIPDIFFEPATVVILQKQSDADWKFVHGFNPSEPEF